jgi:hypothetical protein
MSDFVTESSVRILRTFGGDLPTAALNATRQYMSAMRSLVSKVSTDRRAEKLPNPWKKGQNIDMRSYDKTKPAEILFRVMLCLYHYPNTTWRIVNDSFRSLNPFGAEKGEPITIMVVLGGIAAVLGILGPIVGPMIEAWTKGQDNAAQDKDRKAKDSALKVEQQRTMYIVGGVVVVVLIGGAVVAFRSR